MAFKVMKYLSSKRRALQVQSDSHLLQSEMNSLNFQYNVINNESTCHQFSPFTPLYFHTVAILVSSRIFTIF